MCLIGWIGGWAWSDFFPCLGFGPFHSLRILICLQGYCKESVMSNGCSHLPQNPPHLWSPVWVCTMLARFISLGKMLVSVLG